MTLPKLSLGWSLPELIKNLIEWGRLIEAADKASLKKGQDIEMARASIIITGNDGLRYRVEVLSGVLTATPV